MCGAELSFLQPIFFNPLSAGMTDRQTDRRTDGHIDRQIDTQTNRDYKGVLGIKIMFGISLLQRRPELKKPNI